MKADFSGYATKAGLRCSDGRTIMPGAFKHQDKTKVPLVWQHGHSDPENVVGHAILENRDDGVYAYAFFNGSQKAEHAKELVKHGDINQLSIWANELIEKAGRVLHGAIREVSLVLSGANPGALIDPVTIRHSDGDETALPDEAVIYTGLNLEHSDLEADFEDDDDENDDSFEHADDDDDDDDETVQDVYDSMTDKQKQVLHYMVGEALEAAEDGNEAKQSNLGDDTDDTLEHDNATEGDSNQEGNEQMTHNVFETGGETTESVLSHDDIKEIVASAQRNGSLKHAIEGYALAHSITDIDTLFPDSQLVDSMPQLLARRTEWVNKVLGGATKRPFSRIKTIYGDITEEDARAKGYVKGSMKREEFFSVAKRETTPTTVYKKQKLDRDDIVDITDFDVVMWLKGEMRLMLDEEIARAILLSDGRDVAHVDKINEGNIRPIAKDHELFTITVNVNTADANSSVQEVVDAIVSNRKFYKGSGSPLMFCGEDLVSQFLLLKDTVGRRLYRSLEEVATELRVREIVPVELIDEDSEIVAVIYNPADYSIGTDRGGKVSMFDDFDIDYNQEKYLIETRMSGTLTKLKSAMVIKAVAVGDVLVDPVTAPTFVASTGVVTIPTQTGVEYYDYTNDPTYASELTAGAQSAITAGSTVEIHALPATGYYFATDQEDQWSFTRDAA